MNIIIRILLMAIVSVFALFGGVSFFIGFIQAIKESKSKPTPETRSIVILGHLGAGKTSLWNKLQGKPSDKPKNTTIPVKIPEFQLSLDGKTVTIKCTNDVGGGNDSVCDNYEIVLKDDDTFIYYLIEYDRIEKYEKDIRAQLQKIKAILKSKKIEKYGFKIIFTNFDETKKITKQEAGERLSRLKLKTLAGLDKFADYVDRYDVLNMYEDDDIKSIKNEIINGIKG